MPFSEAHSAGEDMEFTQAATAFEVPSSLEKIKESNSESLLLEIKQGIIWSINRTTLFTFVGVGFIVILLVL